MVVSVGSVGSATGAAGYYAADNYYVAGDIAAPSEWGGIAAAKLGLDGEVSANAFERLLAGELPYGQTLGANGKEHRAGMDLTFSAPKSVSLIAFVGGDKRVLQAHAAAVRSTMAWAEKNLAEARRGKDGRETVQTGNLAYAMFTHNVSRALDPQLHTHVVIANLTQRDDGQWRALKNDQLFKENTLLASIYHAELRSGLNRLGYAVALTGKHGTFEIAGVDRKTIDAWSMRANDIRAKAQELGIDSPQGLRAITERSRSDKGQISAEELKTHWQTLAEKYGTDLSPVIDAAREAARPRNMLEQVRDWGRAMLDRITAAFGPKPEPLLRGAEPALRSANLAAAYAVVAGVRHLSERAATFEPRQLLRAALNFADHGASIKAIESRIAKLIDDRHLIVRKFEGEPRMTTRDILATEKAMVGHVAQGRGTADPIMNKSEALKALFSSALSRDMRLSSEQEAAGSAILSGKDRVLLIQGDAGSGKTSLFTLVREIAERGGTALHVLTPQTKLAQELRRETGMSAETVAALLTRHERLHHIADASSITKARTALEGKLLLVDEASMVSHRQMVGIMDIAAKAGVAKLVLVGDVRQIAPVEAGRPFALLQDHGAPSARLSENRRQLDPDLREAVALAKEGRASDALNVLGERVHEGASPAQAAAQAWRSLSPEERERTALFTSGHRLRHELLSELRASLVQDGMLGKDAITLRTLENLNLTTEQLRRLSSYQVGQILDVHRYQGNVALERGAYDVRKVEHGKGLVTVEKDGKAITFSPERIASNSKGLSLSAPAEIEVRLGDRLMWTANDNKRDIANGGFADVVGINAGTMTLRDRNGEVTLRPDDPMSERLTHGLVLNMHKAQGMTVDRAITVMESSDRMLNSQSLFYVLSSRSREDLQIYTDDSSKLGRAIDERMIASPNASDLMGSKSTKPLGHVYVPDMDRAGSDKSPSTPLDKQAGRETYPQEHYIREPAPEKVKDFDMGL